MILTHNSPFQTLSVDLIRSCHSAIFDPPYSEKVHRKAVSNRTGGAGVRERDLGFDHLSDSVRGALTVACSLVQNWTCVFSDFESIHLWREALEASGCEHIRHVPWCRWSQPQMTGDRPPTGAEVITVAHTLKSNGKPKKKIWNGPGGLTHFGVKSLRGEDKYSCEKPIGIMLDLVSWFSQPGERVLDPTAGVGTTGLACKLLDRSAVLCEAKSVPFGRMEMRFRSPLSGRDRTLVERWVEDSLKRRTAEKATSTAGEARKQRALDDIERVRSKL